MFRSGCCYRRGRGKIFYFRPGHETFPTYHDATISKVIANGVRWARPTAMNRALMLMCGSSPWKRSEADRPMAGGSLVAGTRRRLPKGAGSSLYLRDLIRSEGLNAVIVDLSTTAHGEPADIPAHVVADCHPAGLDAVFTGDRGTAVAGMVPPSSTSCEVAMMWPEHLGSAVRAGRRLSRRVSGRCPLASQSYRLHRRIWAGGRLCRGKRHNDDLFGDRSCRSQPHNPRYPVQCRWRHYRDGPARERQAERSGPTDDRPAIGLTMFGVTTPCVRMLEAALTNKFDCLVFHATGTGGQSMEKLADSGLLSAVLDITTTEVCDYLLGGIFPCTDDRFGAIARSKLPYVGSCGALDMVNFGPPETVPVLCRASTLPPQSSRDADADVAGRECPNRSRIGERLNRCEGPVTLLLPEGGVSLLDSPGPAVLRQRGRCSALRGLGENGATDPPAEAGTRAARNQRSRICSRRAASFPRRGRGGLTHAFQP